MTMATLPSTCRCRIAAPGRPKEEDHGHAPLLYVCLVFGLPAAGKSTLVGRMERELDALEADVVVIRFDDFLEVQDSWNEEEREKWHEGRKRAVLRVKEVLDEWDHQCCRVALVEDNMPYFSMRKPLYRLSQDSE